MKTIGRALAWLTAWKHLSLIAVLAWTSHAHWHLAIQLGAPVWLAPLLPVALDAYVLASFRAWETQANRGPDKVKTMDLLWAIVLDAVAVAGSHASGQYDLTTPDMQWVRAAMAAALGVALVLTMWRVHALDVKSRPTAPKDRRGTATAGATTAPSATVTDITTVRRTAPKARQDGSSTATVTATSQVSDEDPPLVPGGLTDSQASVLAWLLGRGEVRRQEILTALEMPEGTLKKALVALQEKGYVEANEDRRGYYRAVDPMVSTPSEPSA